MFRADRPEPETLHVVVYSHGGRNAGLVVESIVDIVEEIVPMPRESERDGRRQGLLGSAVIQGRVTDLLDVEAVVKSAMGRAN